MEKAKLIIGVDPGSGASSPTGLVVFDPQTLDVLFADNITASKRDLHHRIQIISNQLTDIITILEAEYGKRPITFCVESFVMRGKGGESLQRLIGSFLGRLPARYEVRHVQNTKVKKALAGHGHAEKDEVAAGVLDYFKSNKSSYEAVNRLIKAGEWDILDAFAIGITGVYLYEAD
jgi:Holliday junction resolvasome RuvABC endonuclease subunit